MGTGFSFETWRYHTTVKCTSQVRARMNIIHTVHCKTEYKLLLFNEVGMHTNKGRKLIKYKGHPYFPSQDYQDREL